MSDNTYYKGNIGKEDIEFGTGTFLRRNKDGGNDSFTQLNKSHIPRKILTKTADYEMSEKYEVVITNTGAVATITITLLPAKAGYGPYEFFVDAAQYMQIDPNGTEYFRGGTAGKYKRSNVQGNLLRVWCNINGIWEWNQEVVSGDWDDET